MTALAAAAIFLAGALDSRELFQRVKPSVVQIQVLSPTGELRSLGSGFAATSDGLLITNHHVVEGATRMEALFADGRKMKVSAVVFDDPDHDIAVVRVDEPTTPLQLGRAMSAVVGDEVMLVGSPFGLDFTITVGSVARYRPDGLTPEMLALAGDVKPVDRQPMLQLNASSGQGNSGGPVLDGTGAVLGIVRAGIGAHGNFTFAVPSESIQSALAQAQRVAADTSVDGRLLNVGISALVFGVLAVLYVRMRRTS